MIGSHFVVSFHFHGTLAANAEGRFRAPFDCTLVEVQSVAANNSDATLLVGTTADADKFLSAGVIGDSEVPVTKRRADWNAAGELGRLLQGDVLEFLLDFDGAAGTAGQNVSIHFLFSEG